VSRRSRRRKHRLAASEASTNVENSSASLEKTNRFEGKGGGSRPDKAKREQLVNEAARIYRLIAKKRYKSAIHQAKRIHKQHDTAESEAILVSAYLARIKGFLDSGSMPEAKALMDLVGKEYRSARTQLAELSHVLALRDGLVDDLVGPLNDPELPPEKRTAIENTVRRELTDLRTLADCNSLPPDHPLRRGAAEVAAAFQAVTTGPVRDDQITLEQISHRSPLAPWKLLVRAIACFYRHEDDLCKESLNAIDPQSAPARLVPALNTMLAGESGKELKRPASALVAQVIKAGTGLQDALQRLDGALGKRHRAKTLRGIEQAVRECRRLRPDLLEKLKQHISIRSYLADLPADRVAAAMGGQSLHNAYFWRLLARAAEIREGILPACSFWEEFRRNAIHEGWFKAGGTEEATLYLHMIDLLRRLPKHYLVEARKQFSKMFNGHGIYYENQPESVRAAAPKGVTVYFLYPERLYERACACDPDPQTYRQWLDYIKETSRNGKAADEVALAWHEAAPGDSRPLLHLMASAEKRNALKLALKFLEKAEQIDAVNAEVRRARLRLWVATAIRHLKQKKPHLAEKDLREIAALPQAQEGDRPAFQTAMRWVWAAIKSDNDEVARAGARTSELMESELAAGVVLTGLAKACGLKRNEQPELPVGPALLAMGELAKAVARACALGDDMNVPFEIPREWLKLLVEDLSRDDCGLDTAELRTLAQAALRMGKLDLAYTASGIALRRGGPQTARFLLLRGRSLPEWALLRRTECILSAAELARGQRDMELVNEAMELLPRSGPGHGGGPFDLFDEREFSKNSEKINKVIEREKQARRFPQFLEDDYLEEDDCQCPACRRRRGELGGEEDEDELTDRLDDEQFGPDDLPPEILGLLMKIMLKVGGRIDSPKDIEKAARQYPKLFEELEEAFADHLARGGTLPPFGPRPYRPERKKRPRRRR